MSSLSGYDSEVTGFDSVERNRSSEASSSTQTTEFSESGVGCQTNAAQDIGCMVYPEDLNAEDDVLREYPPPGLNEFLRKVVPAMMDQLDQNEQGLLYDASDSDEEEVITAKLVQEIKLRSDGVGAGDHHTGVLAVSWSSAGHALAVAVGQAQHDSWCDVPGLIQVFIQKRSEGDRLVHELSVSEKNCVTALEYHPAIAGLLAYGTTSGEVVLCDLRNGTEEGTQLTSPSECHGARRVSALHWAGARLANTLLMMQISSRGKRRGASDQILVSAGSDGSVNVWQVNANLKVFENVVTYHINGSKKLPAPDISCIDFAKSRPLRATDDKSDEIFVVGAKSGHLYLCSVKGVEEGTDPVSEALEGHATCVLDVAFGRQPGVFVSVSMDSELRVYDVAQPSPLRVLCLDAPVSCMAWLWPPVVALGLRAGGLKLCNVASGRELPADGLDAEGTVTCLSVSQSGACRVAAGGAAGRVRVWELPRLGRRRLARELVVDG